MSRLRGLGALALVTALASDAAAAWKPKHIDGVVAAVDRKPIVLSEVRLRAKPLLAHMHAAVPKARWAEEETTLMRDLVERLVRERLIAAEMKSAGLDVTDEEVELGVKAVAENAKLTPAQLLVEVKKVGYDEKGYRDELRNQIMEAKWFMRRVKPTLPAGQTDEVALADAVKDLEKKHIVERDLL